MSDLTIEKVREMLVGDRPWWDCDYRAAIRFLLADRDRLEKVLRGIPHLSYDGRIVVPKPHGFVSDCIGCAARAALAGPKASGKEDK